MAKRRLDHRQRRAAGQARSKRMPESVRRTADVKVSPLPVALDEVTERLETNFRLRGVVRDFAAGLSEQSAQTALPANTRTELSGRLDLPGDAQVSRTMPVLHQFRAGMESPAEGTATASLDDLAVLALSQLTQYESEYAAGSIASSSTTMLTA